MLRRRRVGDGSGGSGANPQWKPFVLPVKKIPANTIEDEEEDDEEERKSAERNRQALQRGTSLTVKRLPFLSFVNVQPERREQAAQKLRQAFVSPCDAAGRTSESNRLLQVKTLGMRRRWTGNVSQPLIPHNLPPLVIEDDEPSLDAEPEQPTAIPEEPAAPPAPDAPPPLVLWTSEEDPELKVVVPTIVGKFLRPHQREGVQFMYDCVSQVRGFDGQGCILADDMGLGKTLQSITLMYTLLMTSMTAPNKPTLTRAIVVCPTSLVKNWDDEIIKWLHGRVKTIALFESNRESVIKGISNFIEGSKRPRPSAAQVLIISYETFRMHAQRFHDAPCCCELLICDEAHRLKNANSQINRALSALACRRRVLLSGTPMQNDLEEFYAMVDFTNPNILGQPNEFRKKYLGPILTGREPDATEREREAAQDCSAMLCEIVNQFILRRGNILNAKHLPPKLMQVICSPLSPLQESLYAHFLSSGAFRDMMRKKNANVLSSITALKKLCNHPLLIFDEMGKSNTKLAGFENCAHLFAAAKQGASSADNLNRRGMSGEKTCHPEWSGKMLLLNHLMLSMRKTTTDRIVIVSNYTQTLDVVSSLCRERHLPFVRLDGTTSAKKRKNLVDVFNDPTTNSFAFLLSSKAGGCGLNLIGANRLVLFDPDWNPATDKQAAARVWREGQKKMCYVYRFLATGTLEEKIFQRQLSKEGLQNIVDDKEEVNSLSSKDLKRLFVFEKNTMSDTHDQLKCKRCQWRSSGSGSEDAGGDGASCIEIEDTDESDTVEDGEVTDDAIVVAEKNYHPQIGMPPEEDLNNWGHHRSYDCVDDEVMQSALRQVKADLVSFAFSCRIDWELLQEHQLENQEKENQRDEQRKQKRLEKITKRKAEEEKIKSRKKQQVEKPKKRHIDDDESDDFTGSSSCSEEEEEDVDVADDSDSGSDSEIELVANVQPLTKKPSVPSPASSIPPIEQLQSKTASFVLNGTKKGAVPTAVPSKPTLSEAISASDNDFDDPEPIPKRSVPVFKPRQVYEETKESEPPSKKNGQVPWNCTRCTLENPSKKDICAGCGLRFRRSRLLTSHLSLWSDDEDDYAALT